MHGTTGRRISQTFLSPPSSSSPVPIPPALVRAEEGVPRAVTEREPTPEEKERVSGFLVKARG